MYQVFSAGRAGAEVLLIAGVVIQYLATRLWMGVFSPVDDASAGRRAVAQWVPVASTALAAVALRQPGIAVGLVFGSSVACLSLLMGMTVYLEPMREIPSDCRLWFLLLPACVFVLLAGFRGSFAWYHGLMLLVMGASFLAVWLERGPMPVLAMSDRPAPRMSGWLVAPALALAAGGAWAAINGAVNTSAHSRLLTVGLLSSAVLSPLLLLPSLGLATVLAQRHQTGRVVTALVGTVLLNLCALLPAIILLDEALARIGRASIAADTTSLDAAGLTPYPMANWRVDAVVLVVLAFALAPVAAGRWLPRRLEGMALVVAYAIYLVAETALAARLFS